MENGIELRRSLHLMLTQAEIDLEMWQAMCKSREDREVMAMINRRYSRFYIAAENALFNSLISILYKAFENRKDTINLRQLRRSLPNLNNPNIEAELDTLFKKIEVVWVKVCVLRNNIVGHQSSEKSAEDFHGIANITTLDLEVLVKDMQSFLLLIAKHFHDTHVIFNLKGAKSFENLISDLRAKNYS
ncbi:hypothetical protein EBA02_02730 [Xanthomonas oryzae pv. oryzae]|nr:hypothetical protein EBA02_02730 [Xanthomonas oryzae pv. oryzae]